MRIRKDKKLAQLGLSSDAVHLCQLNQSPWDVPSTTAHLRTSSSSLQVGGGLEDEQVDTGNGSLLGDSLWAFDSSVASMESMRYEDELEDGNGIGIGLGREDNDVVSCNKSTKGKGWQCKKAAKQGEPMCRHHLKSPPPPAAKKKKVGRGRGRPTKKEENPCTFYYYTGFGPTWGRRKRSDAQSQSPEPAHHHLPILYDNDDDSSSSGKEEKDSDTDSQRKRTPRPVKERSLKSLMVVVNAYQK